MSLESRTAEYLARYDDLATAAGRKAFLYVVFGDAGFLGSVDYEGAPREFCRRLLAQLSRLGALADGRDAVVALLEATQSGDLGQDDLRTAGELIQAWRLQGRGRLAAEGDEPPPYKGLQYFDVADAGLFFGRNRLIAELVAFLCDQPLLAVVGASGSGKSSVVRAGVLPALTSGQHLDPQARRPAGSERWPVHLLTPTARPLESLAAALTRGSESVSATATLIDDLARDSRSLHLFARRLLAQGSPGDRLLLVVDQFEELFTLCRERDERKAFVDNLLAAAAPGGVTTVVLTLRADFYAQCAQFPNLRQALERCQRYIGAMGEDELRLAIEAPARQGGWELEPGLVDLLLEDVAGEPGALPLLSHALLETWKRRSGRTLTLAGYQASGRVQGAIAKTADDTFARLTDAEQAIARRIFVRLTELGEGAQDTRRRVPLAELLPAAAASATDAAAIAVGSVVRTLQNARLVTAGAEPGSDVVYVDVAHEALIREWPALRGWLDDDREGLRIHRRLTEAAQEWERLGRDPGALYRGVRLEQARLWAAEHAGELSAQERAFIDTSVAQQEAEQQERERVQREREEAMWREVEAARALAEASEARAREVSRARNWLILFLFVTGLLVVRLVRDGWEWIERQEVVLPAGEPGDLLMADLSTYRLPSTLLWGVVFLGLASAAHRLAARGKALRAAATEPAATLVAGSGRLGPVAGTVLWVAGWILVGVFLFLTVDFIAFGGDLSAAVLARLFAPSA